MLHFNNRKAFPGWLVAFALLLPALGFAQVRFSVKGKVTDAAGEPLIGVNVKLGSTQAGAITDADGMYQFGGSVKEGTYSLDFTYVGYASKSSKVTIGSGNADLSVDMVLSEDIMNLDEVVVTGSTITSTRRQLGNAITSVSGADLAKSGTGNVLGALSGRVPGARITQTSGDPAGGINVNLRGVNSIRGSSDPLYVVDGVIISNANTAVSQTGVDAGEGQIGTNRMADLNPNDIESVNILNGAAAAAIYGSRAANGVVLITTKRGSSGVPQITLGMSANMNELRKKVPINTYGKQFGFAALRLYTISGLSAAQISGNPGVTVDTVFRDGARFLLANNTVDVTRYDYQDEIFQRAYGTDNYISVAGGKDNTKYYVSLSYLKNQGIIRNTDFQRYSLRLNLDQTLTSWAALSFGMNYSNSYANEKPNGNVFFSPINGMTITNNIYNAAERDANGNLKAVEPTRINPLSAVETFDFNQSVNRAISNLKLSLYPLQGLKVDLIAGIDAFSQIGNQYIPIYPYDGVNPLYYANGYASTANNLSYLYNNDINVSYETNINSWLKSTTTAGYNYQYARTDYTESRGEGLVPGIRTVNGAATRNTSYSLDRSWLSGYFLQQTFGINNNLFLTLAGRVDGASKFSPSENNQFYPKASLSYVISENNFWKNSSLNKFWNGLKIRASYGDAGGLTAIGSYDRFYQLSSVNYLNKNTIVAGTQLANPNVRPERTRETEVGADLSLPEKPPQPRHHVLRTTGV